MPEGPPPIPKPAKTRRPLDRIFILLALAAMIAIAWTLRQGPGLIGLRNQAEIAEAGVTNVVAALVTITEDSRVNNLRECFRDPYSLERESMEQTLAFHTDIAYQLLLLGSRASLELKPFARAGLYQGYIDLGTDPWGQQYYVYIGPLAVEHKTQEVEGLWNFDEPTDSEDATAKTMANNASVPPPFVAWPGAHKEGKNARAVPAPAELPFYVICAGPNGVLDQPFMNEGVTPPNGDDITSWDGYAWEVVRGNRE